MHATGRGERERLARGVGRLEEGGGYAAAAEHRYVVARARFLSRSELHSHQKGMGEKPEEGATQRETLHNQTSGREGPRWLA